jgi:ubiquinone/menaquinone biosynthesis C-methylase UbiE
LGHDQHTSRTGHRFPVERRHLLNNEERRQWLPPEPILEAAGIEAGTTVIDVGAGTGFWTIPLSRRVGISGTVIATDVEPIMIEELRELVKAEGIENVSVVETEDLSIPLRDQIADVAFLGFVLHHPYDPRAFLQEVRRLLRPDGRMVVVDWQKWETERGPSVEHRLSEAETRSLLESAGYVAETVAAPNLDVYVLVARLG